LDQNINRDIYQFYCGKNRNREICCNGAVQCKILPARQMIVSGKTKAEKLAEANYNEEFDEPDPMQGF
jgi:hypothetical protein